MLGVIWLLSVAVFAIIELPPGDYMSSYITTLRASGQTVDQQKIEIMTKMYGLDMPAYLRYFKWMGNMFRGNFGKSFTFNRPVLDLLVERLPLTVLISLLSMVFTYAVAIPIGIYSATHQYSVMDYGVTFVGFIGLATPNFLLALVLMLFFLRAFGWDPGGLFSTRMQAEPWSFAKFVDMLKHLPIPIIVIGTAGTAGLIRVMRGCMLDELNKQYVTTARAKGVPERKLLLKYPVRVAMNPIISTIGWMLPAVVSGETITAIVLNLPTTGGLLLGALLNQDTYMAGSTLLILSILTVLGTFISDILLVWTDPRIKFEHTT